MATNRDFTPVVPQKSTENIDKIKAVDAEAAKQGLSYGKYKAKLYAEKTTALSEKAKSSKAKTKKRNDFINRKG